MVIRLLVSRTPANMDTDASLCIAFSARSELLLRNRLLLQLWLNRVLLTSTQNFIDYFKLLILFLFIKE